MSGKGGKRKQWQCTKCTLFNDSVALKCKACESARPAAAALVDPNKDDGKSGGGVGRPVPFTRQKSEDGLRARTEAWLESRKAKTDVFVSVVSINDANNHLVLSLGKKRVFTSIHCPPDPTGTEYSLDADFGDFSSVFSKKLGSLPVQTYSLNLVLDLMLTAFEECERAAGEEPDGKQEQTEEDEEEDEWDEKPGDWSGAEDGADGSTVFQTDVDFVVAQKTGAATSDSVLKNRWLAKEAELRAKSKKTSIFDSDDYKNSSSKEQIFTQQAVTLMLCNSLLQIRAEAASTGIFADAIDDDVFNWRVRFSKFPEQSHLHKDLVLLDSLYERDYVEIEVSFDMNLFPFYPPSVRPVWPRLEDFFMGRIVCMDELLVDKWSPVREIKVIFQRIYALLSSFGRVNVKNPLNDPKKPQNLYPECEFMLWRLSMLTNTPPRANLLMVSADEKAMLEKVTGGKPTLTRQESWSADEKSRNVDQYASYLAMQRKRSQEIRQILGTTVIELSRSVTGSIMLSLLKGSCLLPFLEDELAKIVRLQGLERNLPMTIAVFSVLRGVAAHANLVGTLRIGDLHKGKKKVSLLDHINRLGLLAKAATKAEITDTLRALLTNTLIETERALVEEKKFQEKPELKREISDDDKHRLDNAPKKTAPEKKVPPKENEAQCPICFHNFLKVEIEEHVHMCLAHGDGTAVKGGGAAPDKSPAKPKIPPGYVECPICMEAKPKAEIEAHAERCLRGEKDPVVESKKGPSAQFDSTSQGSSRANCKLCMKVIPDKLKEHKPNCWKCPCCSRSIMRESIARHIKNCIERAKTDDEEQINVHMMRKEQGVLNEMQLAAVTYVMKESKKMHDLKYDSVVKKFQEIKLTEDDLKTVLRYVRSDAPLIVHCHMDKTMGFLVKDTHYRNQFETNTSHGTLSHSTRVGWEDRMFNKVYHSAKGFDRVKYGVMNLANSPYGVKCAYSYGDSYFILKNVRLRCTFASCDSGSSSALLSSCEYYTHVLDTYNNNELKAIYEVASGKVPYIKNDNVGVYKEIQVHGPLRLDRDVQAVVVNLRHKGDAALIKQIEQFCKNNGCHFIWMSK